MTNFKISASLKNDILSFISSVASYQKCVQLLSDENREDFTEEEMNMIINLLGIFRLAEVYPLIERFKTETVELKEEPSDMVSSDKS